MKLQVLYVLKEQKMKVKTEDVRYDNIENNMKNMFFSRLTVFSNGLCSHSIWQGFSTPPPLTTAEALIVKAY